MIWQLQNLRRVCSVTGRSRRRLGSYWFLGAGHSWATISFGRCRSAEQWKQSLIRHGHPAAWPVSLLCKRGIRFCMLCDKEVTGWSAVKQFLRSGSSQANVTLRPMHSTGTIGEFLADIRYKAWNPPRSLHPSIGLHAPLTIGILDTWMRCSLGGCQQGISVYAGFAQELKRQHPEMSGPKVRPR